MRNKSRRCREDPTEEQAREHRAPPTPTLHRHPCNQNSRDLAEAGREEREI